jgi:putative AdoMet-dependent methyltransferase
MKSIYAQKFNHDPSAAIYDQVVKNEKHPIRTGYTNMMKWVNENTQDSNILVDLGCGTGNTTKAVEFFDKIYCVDVSQNMLNIATSKLKNEKNIIFIKTDLLELFDDHQKFETVDTIISTYAIHHLTQDEKHLLFEKVYILLPKGGKVVLGDLMFKNSNYENEMREKYPELNGDFDDEYYWNLEDEIKKLQSLGFRIEITKFSDLSWGIIGEK